MEVSGDVSLKSFPEYTSVQGKLPLYIGAVHLKLPSGPSDARDRVLSRHQAALSLAFL